MILYILTTLKKSELFTPRPPTLNFTEKHKTDDWEPRVTSINQ